MSTLEAVPTRPSDEVMGLIMRSGLLMDTSTRGVSPELAHGIQERAVELFIGAVTQYQQEQQLHVVGGTE